MIQLQVGLLPMSHFARAGLGSYGRIKEWDRRSKKAIGDAWYWRDWGGLYTQTYQTLSRGRRYMETLYDKIKEMKAADEAEAARIRADPNYEPKKRGGRGRSAGLPCCSLGSAAGS